MGSFTFTSWLGTLWLEETRSPKEERELGLEAFKLLLRLMTFSSAREPAPEEDEKDWKISSLDRSGTFSLLESSEILVLLSESD